MKQPALKITFHNPNTVDETVEALVKITAEVAAEKVRQEIIHSECGQAEPEEYEEEMIEPQLSM